MFDIGWSEILLIGVLTLLVVGPKELPNVMRSLFKAVRYLRNLSGDMYRQMEEISDKAGLAELQKMKSDQIGDHLKKQLDPTDTFNELEEDLKEQAAQIQETVQKGPKASVAHPDVPEPIYDHSVFLNPQIEQNDQPEDQNDDQADLDEHKDKR